MKLLYALLSLICFTSLYAQKVTTMNKGEVSRKNYMVTVPYKDVNGYVIIEGTINGRAYNFLVDTGATVAVSPKLYKELGLSTYAKIPVSDSGNLEDNMEIILLPDLQIGDITFSNSMGIVLKNFSMFECFGIDGFIGSNMLRNSAVKFSYKNKTVTLTDMPQELKPDKQKGTKLSINGIQSFPSLTIDLKSESKNSTGMVMFDTGMTGFYALSKSEYLDKFEKKGLIKVKGKSTGATSTGIHGVSAAAEQYNLVLDELCIAGSCFKNISFSTISSEESLLGSGLLRYGDVTVDYIGRKLYFERYKEDAGAINMQVKRWPFDYVLKGNKIVVSMIWDTSLEQNIKLGDEIVKFGDTTFEAMDRCEFFRGNATVKGEKALLVLKDAQTGQIKEVQVSKI